MTTVRELRRSAGLSVAALSEATGLHRNTVTRIDQGHSASVPALVAVLRAIDKAYAGEGAPCFTLSEVADLLAGVGRSRSPVL